MAKLNEEELSRLYSAIRWSEKILSPHRKQRTARLRMITGRNFGDYAARLEETSLSANDKKALLGVFNEAAALTVNAPADLKNFVHMMTEQENRLVEEAKLDNPKLVLSMVSVLKNSRYFWYWKSISSPDGGAGTVSAGKIPDWVWADIIGMELGGPVGSAIASTLVYLDQR